MRRWGRTCLWSAAAFLVATYLFTWLPYPPELLSAARGESWRIYDKHGTLLRESVGRSGMRSRWTPLEEISKQVVAATIAAEDSHFYDHSGVDGRAVVRALYQNVTHRRIVSGASTLTMQLVRLHEGVHRRTFLGKARQALQAMRLERSAGKATILEQYLNLAPYGAGTVGIEAASQRYFGKPTHHLSLSEAALLAGLPKAPTDLNPLKHMAAARTRHAYVLDRMLAVESISRAAYRRALVEQPRLVRAPPVMHAGHFTDHLLTQGLLAGDATTTLDLSMQSPIERLVRGHVDSLAGGGLTNAAVVVLDNRECDTLVMAGSVDYWSSDAGSVNGATARRQPGSALKPFTYALAYEFGYEPTSALSDIPTVYAGGDGTLLRPKNYSERFVGPVLAADALGRSLNVPAIRLANAVGIEQLHERLVAAGFRSLERDVGHYGLGLTLGNGEVTLMELAQGYAMFARGGMGCTPRVLSTDPTGPGERIFSQDIAYLITHTLSDESLRIRAFGASNPLLFGYPVAVKTGTSSNWRDSWAVGYTGRYTVAVWSGDFAGRPMHELSGSVGAGPLFYQVIDFLVHRGSVARRPQAPEPPATIQQVLVCSLSGMSPTEHCPSHREMAVQITDAKRPACTWHRPMLVDSRNGLLASNRCPQQFVEERVFDRLPSRYAKWQADNTNATRPAPSRYSPMCPVQGLTPQAVVITHPRPQEVYLIEPGYARATQTLALEAEVDPAVGELDWLIDGQRVASVAWPYRTSWPLERGTHRVQAVMGERTSDPVDILVR